MVVRGRRPINQWCEGQRLLRLTIRRTGADQNHGLRLGRRNRFVHTHPCVICEPGLLQRSYWDCLAVSLHVALLIRNGFCIVFTAQLLFLTNKHSVQVFGQWMNSEEFNLDYFNYWEISNNVWQNVSLSAISGSPRTDHIRGKLQFVRSFGLGRSPICCFERVTWLIYSLIRTLNWKCCLDFPGTRNIYTTHFGKNKTIVKYQLPQT